MASLEIVPAVERRMAPRPENLGVALAAKGRTSRFRVSLRVAFGILTIACIGIAFVANKYHSRKAALAILERRGVSVHTEDAALPEVVRRLLPAEMACVVKRIDVREMPPDAEILWAIVQLSEVRDVGFYKSQAGTEVSVALNKLPCLEEVSFHSSIIEAGTLQKIHRSRKLTTITLTFSNATDADCQQLADFPSLSRVYMYGTGITDEGLSSLRDLPTLAHLGMSCDFVTKQGIEELCEKHPRLVLSFGGPEDFGEDWWTELKRRHPQCTIRR
ncbi:MAG: hypothetical protein ACKVP0_10050 [Pirellulaceae bacterium]